MYSNKSQERDYLLGGVVTECGGTQGSLLQTIESILHFDRSSVSVFRC